MDQPTLQCAFIALGSNLGDRAMNLRDALRRLRTSEYLHIERVSAFLDNPAVGGPNDSPPFLNAVVAVKTTLEPEALLDRLLGVERDMGRRRDVKWEPRLIDLDLLLYGDRVVQTQQLTVPHPLLHVREFVLKPLTEIAPLVMHPVLERTIVELWEQLEAGMSTSLESPCPIIDEDRSEVD